MRALRFNQDATCCVVEEARSVSIYNCDPFGKCFDMAGELGGDTDGGDTGSGDCVVEMLFATSLVAVAENAAGRQGKLKIVNTKRRSTICELVFPHEIVDVVMNRKRMCILLADDKLHIYDISCMKPLDTLDLWEDRGNWSSTPGAGGETAFQGTHTLIKKQLGRTQDGGSGGGGNTGSRGRYPPRMALSTDDRSILCFTAYHTAKNDPQNTLLRDIVVYDALNVRPVNYLNSVHRGNIACLAVDHSGQLIATGSERGTILRVFRTGVDKEFYSQEPLMREFRRGNRPCHLRQLTFNRAATLLGCVGDTDTIHIFQLAPVQDDAGPLEEQAAAREGVPALQGAQLKQFLSKHIRASIPNQNLQRDFAHIAVREGTGYILGFPDEFPNQVYLAGDDASFNVYSLPATRGQCVLMNTNKFVS